MTDRIFRFRDGYFRFYTVQLGKWAHNRIIVLRIRIDRKVKDRLNEKRIFYYESVDKSKDAEIHAWIDNHPTYPVISTYLWESEGFEGVRNAIISTAP